MTKDLPNISHGRISWGQEQNLPEGQKAGVNVYTYKVSQWAAKTFRFAVEIQEGGKTIVVNKRSLAKFLSRNINNPDVINQLPKQVKAYLNTIQKIGNPKSQGSIKVKELLNFLKVMNKSGITLTPDEWNLLKGKEENDTIAILDLSSLNAKVQGFFTVKPSATTTTQDTQDTSGSKPDVQREQPSAIAAVVVELLKADDFETIERLGKDLDHIAATYENITPEIMGELETAQDVLTGKLAMCGLINILNYIGEADTKQAFDNAVEEFELLLAKIPIEAQEQHKAIKNQIILITDAIEQKKDSFTDTGKTKTVQEINVGKGIQNGGNSCYLNAVVQALRFIPFESMQGLSGLVERDYETLKGISDNFDLAKAASFCNRNQSEIAQIYTDKKKLQYIPQQIVLRQDEVLGPPRKVQQIRAILQRGNLTENELADIRLFFSELKEEVDKIRDARRRINDLHGTLTQQTLTVSEINTFRNFLIDECGFANSQSRYTQEDATDVCGAIFRATGVRDFYKTVGIFYGWMNTVTLSLEEGASSMQKLLQDVQLETAPPVLPLQLDRFPEGSGGKSKDSIQPEHVIQVNIEGRSPAMYALKSVVVHSGSTPKLGHYYAYVPQADGSWVKFDDSSVNRPSAKDVMADASKNGLLYFYELIPDTEE